MLSGSLLAYPDCTEVFEKALADTKGVRLIFPSKEAAIYFRMRLNQARQLHRNLNAETYERGHMMHGRSEYDKLRIRIRSGKDRYFMYVEQIEHFIPETVPLSTLVEDDLINPPPPQPPPNSKEERRPLETVIPKFVRRV